MFPHGEPSKPSLFSPGVCLTEDDAALLHDLAEEVEGRPARHCLLAEEVPDDVVVGHHHAVHTAHLETEDGAQPPGQTGEALVGMGGVQPGQVAQHRQSPGARGPSPPPPPGPQCPGHQAEQHRHHGHHLRHRHLTAGWTDKLGSQAGQSAGHCSHLSVRDVECDKISGRHGQVS